MADAACSDPNCSYRHEVTRRTLEAETALSACQEELARGRKEWIEARIAGERRVETARDEAVKREKALEELLERTEAHLQDAGLAVEGLREREKALREALENALAADTESETRHIICAALDQSGKGAQS